MEINDKSTKNSNIAPEKIPEDNNVITLLDEMQITFPNQISHDVYRNAVEDYFESLSTVLKQFL